MRPPKKTLRRYEIPGTARFLTFSCFQRLRLFDNDRIKARFVERLTTSAESLEVQILAWVVMPEHVHAVAYSDETTMSRWMSALKRPFSVEILKRWREKNAPVLPRLRDRDGRLHFWQAGGGYDRNVVGDELLEKIRYCHRNPITRGFVESSVDWPWSSARRYESRDDAIGPTLALDLVPASDRSLT